MGDKTREAQENNRESTGLKGFWGWSETLHPWYPERGMTCFSHKGVKAGPGLPTSCPGSALSANSEPWEEGLTGREWGRRKSLRRGHGKKAQEAEGKGSWGKGE